VRDPGAGIAPDVVARIFDYERQTSSREAYVEPTRGAQGNALQTILAMPYVLSGQRGEMTVESRGVRHDLVFIVDRVTLNPTIEHEQAPGEVADGARFTVRWPDPLDVDDLSASALCFRLQPAHGARCEWRIGARIRLQLAQARPE
jgi:signal transduction histidine kinase